MTEAAHRPMRRRDFAAAIAITAARADAAAIDTAGAGVVTSGILCQRGCRLGR